MEKFRIRVLVSGYYDWEVRNKYYIRQRAEKKVLGSWYDYQSTYSVENIYFTRWNQTDVFHFNNILTSKEKQTVLLHLASIDMVEHINQKPNNYTPQYLPTGSVGIEITVGYRGSSKKYTLENDKRQITNQRASDCNIFYL
ncbi:MAG: hypothetical protein ACK5IJ_08995 [Mangrovibacterium sp.]